ncbi:RHS repeat-associated core domain-containing protein [Neisseria mucosa]|uniref:RHS family protein n=3 Tax=Neisseriaceae TaxID=481 RepID=A0AA36UFR0_9NEIS|nr:RHS family protein [Neisseria macacae ATCC 33926]
MAQLGGRPVPKKDATPLSDDLDSQTRFVWDGSHLLQEVHSDGRYTYIYTDPSSYEPLAQVRDWTTAEDENRQETNYFHCDQIGIPREMTDKDGNLLWFGNYTGWGRLKEETRVTDTAYQPFRLQNQYADRETGLHYNFLRYYEPDAGRFVSQDPIKLLGGDNLYFFAPNPLNWLDELGLRSRWLRNMLKNKDKTISPVDGRTVYQDDRIIDWAKSDICKMYKDGAAAKGTDGKSIQLHHVEGKEPGPMLEILASIHLSFKKQSNGKNIYNLLHPYVKPGYQSFRRNPNLNASYENFRKEHWKKRAESYLKSRGKCAEEECG